MKDLKADLVSLLYPNVLLFGFKQAGGAVSPVEHFEERHNVEHNVVTWHPWLLFSVDFQNNHSFTRGVTGVRAHSRSIARLEKWTRY